MKTRIAVLIALLISSVCAFPGGEGGSRKVTVEIEEVTVLDNKYDLFDDDRLEDKHTVFDSELVDSRPIGDSHESLWEINASAAVIGLDVPEIRDIDEEYLHELYPSYADAAKALAAQGKELLPSINMLVSCHASYVG